MGIVALFLPVLPEKSSQTSFLMFDLAVFKLQVYGIILVTILFTNLVTATVHYYPARIKQP